MMLAPLILSQQSGPESALTSGWLDPLFLGFMVAATVQLFLVVWALTRRDTPAPRRED